MKVCSVCHGSHQNSAACIGEFIPDRNEIQEAAVDLIPGFHLDGLLTSTSSTATYRARETASGRSCLVKIFTADEAGSEQILREAKVAAALFHPGIVGFYEAGNVDDGRTFVASEDADGRTLREVLDNVGSPDLLTTIEIIRQAAESLHALHLTGLIHGAINPRNIILSMPSDGRPVVRLQHPDLGRTAQRSIISNRFLIDSEIDSLRYFAPEQCSGNDASAQSDIYSLGILFYEMLSGSPPFDAPTAVALIHQQKNQRPPEVKIENFNLRMLVTHALTEALQKHARLRQSSADLFARQLRHIEQLATHSSTPPPAGAIRVSAPAPMPVVVPSRIIEPAPAVMVKAEAPDVRSEANAKAEQISLPKIERETIATRAGEPLPVTGSDVAVFETAEREESAVSVSAEPSARKISVTKPIYVASRSRLRLWKKKLRSLAERVTPEAKALTSSIFESAGRTIVDPTLQAKADDLVEPVKRRKVEWQTPEDDIPTEAAVIEVLEKEGAILMPAVVASNEEPRETPVVIEPPTVIATRVVKETPVVIATPVVNETPKVIETPVGIQAPLMDERPRAVDRRAKDQGAEATEDRPKKMATRRVTPNPVVRVTPKEKAAEPAGAVPARIVPRMAGVETIDAKIRAPKNSTKRSGLGFKVNLADLEEITLVRPPSKRIRIDWERAVARPDLSNIQPRRPQLKASEIGFSPTILGGAPDRMAPVPERSGGMFSAFDGSSSPGIYNRRSVILGGGVLALITLILFGSGFVTALFETSSAADSVTASASLPSVSQQISAPAAPTVSAAKQKALTGSAASSSEKPVPETISISERVSRPAIRSAASEVAADAKTKAPTKPRAASSDEGSRKKELRTDDRKRSGEKSVTPAFKPATFTRPRIVKTEP